MMNIINTTTISSDKLRAMICFVKPRGIARIKITFRYKSGCDIRGYAYCSVEPKISVIIGSERYPNYFPRVIYKKDSTSKGYLPCLLLDEDEALVYVIAHELRHIWQIEHSGCRVWGSKGRFSERDADAYAIAKLRAWRRSHRSSFFECVFPLI